MSLQKYEERGGTTTGTPCQYASLAHYNTNTRHNLGPGGTQQPPHNLGPGGTQQPPGFLPGQTLKPEHDRNKVIPVYGGVGYDTLQGSCSRYTGYKRIDNAYSDTGGGCAQKYINRSCQ